MQKLNWGNSGIDIQPFKSFAPSHTPHIAKPNSVEVNILFGKVKMKAIPAFVFWLLAATFGYSAERPTIESLVGREFAIRDDWAGQELTFRRKEESIVAVWRILGSGVHVLSEVEIPIRMMSAYQCTFVVHLRDETRVRLKVGIGEKSEIQAFLNGIRIHLEEMKPNQPSEPMRAKGPHGSP